MKIEGLTEFENTGGGGGGEMRDVPGIPGLRVSRREAGALPQQGRFGRVAGARGVPAQRGEVRGVRARGGAAGRPGAETRLVRGGGRVTRAGAAAGARARQRRLGR